jgi:hypothetical protein
MLLCCIDIGLFTGSRNMWHPSNTSHRSEAVAVSCEESLLICEVYKNGSSAHAHEDQPPSLNLSRQSDQAAEDCPGVCGRGCRLLVVTDPYNPRCDAGHRALRWQFWTPARSECSSFRGNVLARRARHFVFVAGDAAGGFLARLEALWCKKRSRGGSGPSRDRHAMRRVFSQSQEL